MDDVHIYSQNNIHNSISMWMHTHTYTHSKIGLLFWQRPLLCKLHLCKHVLASLPRTTQSQHCLITWPTAQFKTAAMIIFGVCWPKSMFYIALQFQFIWERSLLKREKHHLCCSYIILSHLVLSFSDVQYPFHILDQIQLVPWKPSPHISHRNTA